MPNVYKPQEIDFEKWLERKNNDTINFSNDIPHLIDKRGIIGKFLFDLTLDNQSSIISHRSVSVLTGNNVAKGMFHALCPELETFVTLTNWMGSSSERKTERVKFYKELEKFIVDDKLDKVCKISGNYRIKNGEFATITLSWANLEIKERDKRFYDWERVPFIKRSAENFSYFMSPTFMSSIPSGEENVSEDKVSYFSLLFKVKSIQNNIVRLFVPHCTNPNAKETDVIVYDLKLLDNLKQNSNSFFIGLLEDKVYKKKKLFHREFVLLNISKKLDGNDIAGHLIAQRLYYNYLKDGQLYLCTKDEFQKRCNIVFYHVKKSYNEEVSISYDFFSKLYLESYFINIDNEIYYKPFIFKDLDKESYIEFIKYQNEKKKKQNELFNQLKIMKLYKRFGKFESYLEFLNSYNFYSKRTLIDLINKWEEKWRV